MMQMGFTLSELRELTIPQLSAFNEESRSRQSKRIQQAKRSKAWPVFDLNG